MGNSRAASLISGAVFFLILQVPPGAAGDWPVLKTYDRGHVERIALPLGGIGTGTISLGGRGNLIDWEIMNRPAKGYIPYTGQQLGPFFALNLSGSGGETWTRALEGPLPFSVYEESHGSTAVNHGLPRFRECSFATAYPLGQVLLSDPEMPVDWSARQVGGGHGAWCRSGPPPAGTGLRTGPGVPATSPATVAPRCSR